MSILVLQTSWFLAASNESLGNLRRVINKSYDKVRYKYGVINSSRIKSSQSFLADFEIVKEKKFALFVLLAPPNYIEDEEVSIRFSKESTGVSDIYDSDLPSSFELTKYKLDTLVVDDNFEVNDDIVERVVSTLALKDEKSKDHTVREMELSAFTSFARGSGPAFLTHVIENFIKSNHSKEVDELLGINREIHKKVEIISVVIREHDLVRFYESKLEFQKMAEDELLEVGADGTIKGLEHGVFAHRSFHLAFLNRVIDLQK